MKTMIELCLPIILSALHIVLNREGGTRINFLRNVYMYVHI